MADDIARLGYEIDSTQARTAAGDLDKLNAASVRVAKGYDSLSNASRNLLRDEKGKFMGAQAAAAKYASEIDMLRMKYNPLYAASKQLTASQNEIRRALELGAITSKQASNALDVLEAKFGVTGRAAQVMGQQVKASTAHTTNLMFQFQDIGMMLAAGQNPLMLAMQQGTQVSGVFQQMRNSGQSAFSGIKAGLLAMASPMALATIGIIAGVAALTQWAASAWGAGEDAKSLGEIMDELGDKVDAVKRQSEIFTLSGLEQLRAKYGDVDGQVLNLIANQKIYNDMLASQSLSTAIQGLLDSAGSRWFDIGIDDFTSSVLNLQSTLNVTRGDAVTLKNAFNDLASAGDYQSQLTALGQMGDYMAVLAATTGEGQSEAIRLLGVINDATDAVKQLASSAPGAEWMAGAQAGVRDLIVLLDAAGNILPNDGRGGTRPKMRPMDLGQPEPPRKKRGGGGKSDAEILQDEMKKRYEVLSEGFKSETALAMTNYVKDLETLKWALEQKKLTQSEYKVAQDILRIETWGSEFEQQQLQYQLEQDALAAALEKKYITEKDYQQRIAAIKTAERNVTLMQTAGLFGSLQQMAQAGGAKLAKTAAIFGGIQATIASYVAATKAMAETPGSMFTRIAAYASVLATGLGAVAAIKSAGSGGGGGGMSSAPASASGTTQQAQPERRVMVSLDGPDWVKSIIEPIMTQIYEQTGDGTKVIFSK